MTRIKFNPFEKKGFAETLNDNNTVIATFVEDASNPLVETANVWSGVKNYCVTGLVNALANRYKKHSSFTISVNNITVVKK